MLGIANLVTASTDPSFVSLQPHAKIRNDSAWVRAYSLVTAFLANFEMSLTAQAISLEVKEQKVPTEAKFKPDVSDYMDDLLAVSQALGEIDFGQRVGVFVGEREKAKLKPVKRAPIQKASQPPPKQSPAPAAKPTPASTAKPAPKPAPASTAKPPPVSTAKPAPVPAAKPAPASSAKPVLKQEKEPEQVEKKSVGKPPIPKPAVEPKSPVKQEQPFKKPTIRDLSNAPAMMRGLSSDFTDESDVSPRKKEEISVEDFDSEASPRQSKQEESAAKSDALEDDMDDFVDVPEDEEMDGSKVETSFAPQSPTRESDFDQSVDFVEPESLAQDSDDDVGVDVDVPVDDPVDESSKMMIQLPESSVMEQPGGDSDIDVFVEGDSDVDIVEDFDSN